MRQLTSFAENEKDSTTTTPVNIVGFEFGGEVGTKYYSDREVTVGAISAEARVTSWGSMMTEAAVGSVPHRQSVTIELSDHDGELSELIDSTRAVLKQATIWQHFDGGAESDLTVLLKGVLDGPVKRSEDGRTLTVTVTDTGKLHSVTVGTIATRDRFEDVSVEDEGHMLPVVVGRVKKVRAVHVAGGRKGKLLCDCTHDDTTLYVTGFEDLPADTELTVRIGLEEIEGTIDGTTFTVTQRGRTILNSTTTDSSEENTNLIDTSLEMVDNQYVGYFVKVWVPPFGNGASYTIQQFGGARINPPGGRYQYRLIRRCDASTGKISYCPSFTVEGPPYVNSDYYFTIGTIFQVPSSTAYSIVSLPTAHTAGSTVAEVLDGYVYIVNDRPSVRVGQVLAFGRQQSKLNSQNDIPFWQINFGGGAAGQPTAEQLDEEAAIFDEDTWIPIPPELYQVNRNDSTSFPSLDHSVTTVTLWRNPTELPTYRFRGDELLVDVEGLDTEGDGSGEVIRNPAAVIKTILKRIGGFTDEELDGNSFQAAETATADLSFAFALTRPVRLDRLCSDLAFQSRLGFVWTNGLAGLATLSNSFAGSAPSISRSDEVQLDTIERDERKAEDVTTEIEAVFYDPDAPEKRNRVLVYDTDAEAEWGRRTRVVDFWAYSDRTYVQRAAHFWLERWKGPWRSVSFHTYLTTLEIEPGDVVELDFPGYFPSGQRGEVASIEHGFGSGRDGKPDVIRIKLRIPSWAGCSTSCEVSCETGCESSCELGCQLSCQLDCQLTCEDSCQTFCEVACDSAAEAASDPCATSCTIGCEVMITGGGNWGECPSCETSCESFCEYGSCETSCQLTCELTCETGCEVSCETGCETSCETGCETSCEEECETHCEIGCEISCETGCEMSCQTGCQLSCEEACELSCQTGCETSCETACEVSCQTSCELSGCEVACETTGEGE